MLSDSVTGDVNTFFEVAPGISLLALLVHPAVKAALRPMHAIR